ncbi:nucleolar complex protein [Apiospora arundinis]|uniref:Clr5 domain-containing protein n=1 Tax=Apiospora arundinis TaxID=335852 RepID=A0ABR2IUC8_9PEZI
MAPSALLPRRGDPTGGRGEHTDNSNEEQALRQERSSSAASPSIIHSHNGILKYECSSPPGGITAIAQPITSDNGQAFQSFTQPHAGDLGRVGQKRSRRSKPADSSARAHRGVGRISQYSEDEWDKHKATLNQMYMVEGRTLQEVQQIMKTVYSFPATTKMFKTRFKRWGWVKNISRKNPNRGRATAAATTSGEGSATVTRGHRRGRLMTNDMSSYPTTAASAVVVAPRWLDLPDQLAFQELPLATSRAYVRSQFESQGWVAEALGTKQVRVDHDRFDFTDSEITILWTLHLIKIGCVTEALRTIDSFCHVLRKGVTTLHPLMLYEFWLLWRKTYDICVLVHDDKFNLLKILIKYLCAATEVNFRQMTLSSHPVSRILRFSKAFLDGECNDAVIMHAVNGGIRASAHSLEEMLGHDHPTILMAWNTLAWYQRGSVASSKNFVRQYRKALRRAESDPELGPHSTVAIGILFDFLYHVFYVLKRDGEDGEDTSETEPETGLERVGGGDGCCARSIAEDLLRRCTLHIMADGDGGGQRPLVIIYRAYASSMLMVGILELEAGDTWLFSECILEATTLLRDKGHTQLADMLDLDCQHLLVALEQNQNLRDLPLNLSRPRCSDAEREVYVV